MSCGCSGGDSPPQTTPTSSSPPQGAGHSFAGSTVLHQRPCTPAPCPPPPLTRDPRDPYCPAWVSQITGTHQGKALLKGEDCMYYLRSRCSGVLTYDAATELVKVGDPAFVNATPRETNFGFLAKVVAVTHPICDPISNDCVSEVRMELASQAVGLASSGDLAILTRPRCGDLPDGEDTDAGDQVRVDALDPLDGDKYCGNIRLLGFIETTADGTTQRKWIKLKSIKLPLSSWNKIAGSSAEAKGGFNVKLVKTAGGTDADPCYQLKAIEADSGGIPDGTECGDSLIWNATDKKWEIKKPGLQFYPLATPALITSSVGTQAVTLPSFPTPPCKGKPIYAVFKYAAQSFPGGSGSPGGLVAFLNETVFWNLIVEQGSYGDITSGEVRIKVTSANNNIVFTTAAGTSLGFTLYLLGYMY